MGAFLNVAGVLDIQKPRIWPSAILSGLHRQKEVIKATPQNARAFSTEESLKSSLIAH